MRPGFPGARSDGNEWPVSGRHRRSGAQPLQSCLQLLGSLLAQLQDQHSAVMDETGSVDQQDLSCPLPAGPSQVFVQVPPTSHRMQVEGEDGGLSQGCIGSEFAAGHRAAGEPVLEAVMCSLRIPARTIQQVQHRLRCLRRYSDTV